MLLWNEGISDLPNSFLLKRARKNSPKTIFKQYYKLLFVHFQEVSFKAQDHLGHNFQINFLSLESYSFRSDALVIHLEDFETV